MYSIISLNNNNIIKQAEIKLGAACYDLYFFSGDLVRRPRVKDGKCAVKNHDHGQVEPPTGVSCSLPCSGQFNKSSRARVGKCMVDCTFYYPRRKTLKVTQPEHVLDFSCRTIV